MNAKSAIFRTSSTYRMADMSGRRRPHKGFGHAAAAQHSVEKKRQVSRHAALRAQVASIFLQVHALAQLLAGFEMRNILRRHLHFLAGLGIASGARGPIIQSEAAE